MGGTHTFITSCICKLHWMIRFGTLKKYSIHLEESRGEEKEIELIHSMDYLLSSSNLISLVSQSLSLSLCVYKYIYVCVFVMMRV